MQSQSDDGKIHVSGPRRSRDRLSKAPFHIARVGKKTPIDAGRIRMKRALQRAERVRAAMAELPSGVPVTHESIAGATGLPIGILRWEYPTLADLTSQRPPRQPNPKEFPVMTATTANTVDDILEIKDLNARYNFAVDERDPEAWAATFTSTGVFHALLEGETPTGTAELRTFVHTVNEAFGTMHHFTTNEIITINGDTAVQKCYLLFFYEKDGHSEGSICVYTDTLEREDGAWKYSDRKVDLKTKVTDIRNTL
jgi:ketosteroid isomerase-like protein